MLSYASSSHFGSVRQFKGGRGAGLTGCLDEVGHRLFHFVRDSQPPFEYPGPGCRPNPSSRAAAWGPKSLSRSGLCSSNIRRKGVAHEIVVFSVGSRSAVSIPGEENFILAKNMPLDGTKPDSSLLLMEASLG